MHNPDILSLAEKDIPALTQQITDSLAPLGFPGTARQNLEDLLEALHQEPPVSTIALVSVSNEISGPRLDIYALWGHPIDLRRDAEEIARVVSLHAQKFELPLSRIADTTNHYYGTFIHPRYPQIDSSAELLRDGLVKQYGLGPSGVLAVATLMRP